MRYLIRPTGRLDLGGVGGKVREMHRAAAAPNRKNVRRQWWAEQVSRTRRAEIRDDALAYGHHQSPAVHSRKGEHPPPPAISARTNTVDHGDAIREEPSK